VARPRTPPWRDGRSLSGPSRGNAIARGRGSPRAGVRGIPCDTGQPPLRHRAASLGGSQPGRPAPGCGLGWPDYAWCVLLCRGLLRETTGVVVLLGLVVRAGETPQRLRAVPRLRDSACPPRPRGGRNGLEGKGIPRARGYRSRQPALPADGQPRATGGPLPRRPRITGPQARRGIGEWWSRASRMGAQRAGRVPRRAAVGAAPTADSRGYRGGPQSRHGPAQPARAGVPSVTCRDAGSHSRPPALDSCL
jgi:hypothetical protein